MQLLTIDEMATTLRVSASTARRMCAAGEIPGAVKMGKSWRVAASVFNAWTEQKFSPAPCKRK